MQNRFDTGASPGEPISIQSRRGLNLAEKIASARASRSDQPLSREDFMDDPMPEVPDVPEAFEQTHQEFREELRQIIKADAERAANEVMEPSTETLDSLLPSPRRHSRFKTALYWLGCFVGISAVAYGLTRTS